MAGSGRSQWSTGEEMETPGSRQWWDRIQQSRWKLKARQVLQVREAGDPGRRRRRSRKREQGRQTRQRRSQAKIYSNKKKSFLLRQSWIVECQVMDVTPCNFSGEDCCVTGPWKAASETPWCQALPQICSFQGRPCFFVAIFRVSFVFVALYRVGLVFAVFWVSLIFFAVFRVGLVFCSFQGRPRFCSFQSGPCFCSFQGRPRFFVAVFRVGLVFSSFQRRPRFLQFLG